MTSHRIRTTGKALEQFQTPTKLYEAMLKVKPELKGKVKMQSLFAPKEIIIRVAPDLVTSVLTTLAQTNTTAVHLEGDALLVRNVPTEISPEKVQALIQQELQLQILFVDMFRPTKKDA